MIVKKAWLPAKGTYSVGPSTNPFDPTLGDLSHNPLAPCNLDLQYEAMEEKGSSYHELMKNSSLLQDFLHVASLANLAHVHEGRDGWTARGDPTEIAIQVFASRFNLNRDRLIKGLGWTHVAEFPFDSTIKRMSVIFTRKDEDQKMTVFTKGAVERVVEACKPAQVSMKA